MPVICIGPVCVPLNLLGAFLVSIAHRYGYLKWFKAEWLTFRFAKRKATQGWHWLTGKEGRKTGVEAADSAPATAEKEEPSGRPRGQEPGGPGGSTGAGLMEEGKGEGTEKVLKEALQEAEEADEREANSDSKLRKDL